MPLLDPATRDDAIERRADFTLVDDDASQIDFGAAHGEIGLGLILRIRGDQLARDQLFAALDIVAAALQISLGLTQLQATVRRINAREQLSLLDLITFLDQQLHDRAGHFADELGFVFRLQGCCSGIARGQLTLYDTCGLYRLSVLGFTFFGDSVFRRGAARATGEGDDQGDGKWEKRVQAGHGRCRVVRVVL